MEPHRWKWSNIGALLAFVSFSMDRKLQSGSLESSPLSLMRHPGELLESLRTGSETAPRFPQRTLGPLGPLGPCSFWIYLLRIRIYLLRVRTYLDCEPRDNPDSNNSEKQWSSKFCCCCSNVFRRFQRFRRVRKVQTARNNSKCYIFWKGFMFVFGN